MEFRHQGAPAQPTQSTNHVGVTATSASGGSRKSKGTWYSKWITTSSVVLLFSVTILLLAIASLLYYGNGNESKFIDTSKYQAVDLDTGTGSAGSSDQIYFGHIVKLNDKYLVLQDIYYIVPNATPAGSTATSTANNYTLVKLGCELHAPYDRMVINRDHVSFWENLKSSGTVATKIAEYIKQNPNGQVCSAQNATAAPASSTATTPAPAATTTKKP